MDKKKIIKQIKKHEVEIANLKTTGGGSGVSPEQAESISKIPQIEEGLRNVGTDLSLSDNTLKLKNSSGVEIGKGVTLPKGEKGETGVTPNITIGTVTTLEAGQQATVTKTGSKEEPVFNFGIPKGEKGVDGVGGGSVDLSSYQTKNDETLTTTAKTIVGAINENKSSLDDMKSNTYNKSEVDRKISEIVVEGGGISFRDVEEGEIFEIAGSSNPAIYGNLIISTTALTVKENTSGIFTVKLDKAPTNSQTVNISVNNGNCTVNPETLTFTNASYNQAQTITVNGVHDGSHYNDKNSTINITSSNVASKSINVTITNIDEMPSEVVNVQSVSLNKDTHAMKVNETVQLTHTITPPNATNKEVTWETNNSNCTVDNGLVTAKIEGECTITCKTVDGNKTDTCVITVQAKDNVLPDKGYATKNLDVMYDLTKYENGYIGNVIDEINGVQAIVTGQDAYETGRNGFIDKKFMVNKHSDNSKKSTFTIPNRSSFVRYPFSIELYIAPRGNYNTFAANNVLEFNDKLTGLPNALHNSVVFDTKNGGTTGHGLAGLIFDGMIKASGPISQPDFSTNTKCKIYGIDGEYTFYHLVWCFDSNSQKIYVDGVKVGEDTQKSIDLSNSDRSLIICNSELAGDLKLIRVYNSILTDEEVSKNYNNVISTIGGGIA